MFQTYFIALFLKRQKRITSDGNGVLKEKHCQNGFAKFGFGDFSPKNAERPGRPVEVDETHIKAIIDSDRQHNT